MLQGVRYRVLVENVTPTLDVQCLTLNPGFEACCLNPYVLQITYMHFRQEHGPLQARKTHVCLGQRSFITLKASLHSKGGTETKSEAA